MQQVIEFTLDHNEVIEAFRKYVITRENLSKDVYDNSFSTIFITDEDGKYGCVVRLKNPVEDALKDEEKRDREIREC